MTLHHSPHRSTLLLVILLAAALVLPLSPTIAQSPDTLDIPALVEPEALADTVAMLAEDIGPRVAGSPEEAAAADAIAAAFEALGYDVTLQPFDLPDGGTSQNVIASRSGEGPAIVVGAHYDSVDAGTGADDNASGVAVLLAAAAVVAEVETVYPVTFVAFGAEEIGLVGSHAYAESLGENLSEQEVMVMLNIDTVGIGDNFNVYAGAETESESFSDPYTPGPTWARDLALALGADLGHDVGTSPPESWDGFTGPWSDHVPFVNAGIPVIYFERWNWSAGEDPAWGQETIEQDYLHTADDQFANVDPAKIEPVAETAAAVVVALSTGSTQPPAP